MNGPETGFLTVSIPKKVDERRTEHYTEIGEEAAWQVKMRKILEQIEKDGICVDDLLLDFRRAR